MSYLNPIKMYVFTSAIFFIFFFSIVKPEESVKTSWSKKASAAYTSAKIKLEQRKQLAERSLRADDVPDSTKQVLSEELNVINKELERLQNDSSVKLNVSEGSTIDIKGKYATIEQYDSAQNRLPINKRHNWIERKIKHRKIFLDQKYKNDTKAFGRDLAEKFLHSFPQLFFVSLPLIALLLKLLYIRRKNLFYTDHVIYLVHVYCAMFILLFLRMSFSELKSLPQMDWLSYLNMPIILLMLFYLYKSMRNFYAQRRAKTILKFALLIFMSSLVLSLLFLTYGIVSFLTV